MFDARGEAKGMPNMKSTLMWVCCPCSTRGQRNRARRGVFSVFDARWEAKGVRHKGGCSAMSGMRGNAEGVRGTAQVALNMKNAPSVAHFSFSAGGDRWSR